MISHPVSIVHHIVRGALPDCVFQDLKGGVLCRLSSSRDLGLRSRTWRQGLTTRLGMLLVL